MPYFNHQSSAVEHGSTALLGYEEPLFTFTGLLMHECKYGAPPQGELLRLRNASRRP
jgi:hypothetical protein